MNTYTAEHRTVTFLAGIVAGLVVACVVEQWVPRAAATVAAWLQ